MKKPKKRLLNSKKITDSGLMLFMREIATNPKAMGTAFPSSRHLANEIAALVPNDAGLVLELGGGTGVVTAALLNKGIAPEQLVVVERSAKLAKHLQERFAQLRVIHGDARELSELIDVNKTPVHTVVSGLPLRSLPAKIVQAIGAELDNILEDGALYIQFTYSLYRPPLPPSLRLCWVHSEYTWWNFPPARVDVFRYAR